MQRYQTRTTTLNTTLLLTALGVGALVAYGLASPRRRAALLAAGESALDAGSRLAATSADRLHEFLPQETEDRASEFATRARDVSERATSSARAAMHEAVDRAGELMQEARSRARHLPEYANTTAARGVLLTAAAIGAGVYAMQKYGTSERVREKLGADESGTIVVEKTIFINAPAEQVFDAWANYENFPRFMSNVQRVEQLEGDRSHWKIRGPAGIGVEFDSIAQMTRPHELSWQSVPGSTVQNEGRVTLASDGNGTSATVRMSYRPPAGALGQAVSSLFGANPKQEFEEDLNRMKQFIEGGATDNDAS